MIIDFDSRALVRALTATIVTCSKDETRPHLNAILVEIRGATGVRLVSTDGHRLTRWDVSPNDFAAGESPEPETFLMARADADRILKFVKPWKGSNDRAILSRKGNEVSIRVGGSGGSSMQCTAVQEVKFPPYEQVIPTLPATPTAEFIAVNPTYLADLAKQIPEAAKHGAIIRSSGTDLDPIVVTCDGIPEYLGVIMPMRVSDPIDVATARAAAKAAAEAGEAKPSAKVDLAFAQHEKRLLEEAHSAQVRTLRETIDQVQSLAIDAQEALAAAKAKHIAECMALSGEALDQAAAHKRAFAELLSERDRLRAERNELRGTIDDMDRMVNEAQARTMALARKLDALAPAEVVPEPEPEPSAVRLSEPEPDAMALALATIAAAFGQGTAA